MFKKISSAVSCEDKPNGPWAACKRKEKMLLSLSDFNGNHLAKWTRSRELGIPVLLSLGFIVRGADQTAA